MRPPDPGVGAPQAGEWVVWLSHSVLLLVAGADMCEPNEPSHDAGEAFTAVSMPVPPEGNGQAAKFLIAVVVPGHRRLHLADGVDVAIDGRFVHLDGPRLCAAETDIPTLLRESGLAAASREVRAGALALLASVAGSASDAIRLSRSLHLVREVLRERLPQRDGAEDSLGLRVDVLGAVDTHTFYVRGRFAGDVAVAELAIVSPEGSRVALDDRIVTYLPDSLDGVTETDGRKLARSTGFSACFTIDAPSVLNASWVLELRDAGDLTEEVVVTSLVRDPIAVRKLILEDLGNEPGLDDTLLRRHVAPALRRLQPRLRAAAVVTSVRHCGPRPVAPEISVLVALGEEVACLEQHLAQFAADRAMRDAELIYVVDGRTPRLFSETAYRLSELYRMSFTLALIGGVVDRDPLALQAAASQARGRLLLFLDRRVLPAAPGWMPLMQKQYDAIPGVGAVTPKLLYVDELTRSAGVTFRHREHAGRWEPVPLLRGMPRTSPTACTAAPVPGISSACLMIGSDLFQRVHGFRGTYLRDAYEDADLSLRLLGAGMQNWYVPDAELYHLEEHVPHVTAGGNTHRYDEYVFNDIWAAALAGPLDEREAAMTAANLR